MRERGEREERERRGLHVLSDQTGMKLRERERERERCAKLRRETKKK